MFDLVEVNHKFTAKICKNITICVFKHTHFMGVWEGKNN